jgi:hypothetical protein
MLEITMPGDRNHRWLLPRAVRARLSTGDQQFLEEKHHCVLQHAGSLQQHPKDIDAIHFRDSDLVRMVIICVLIPSFAFSACRRNFSSQTQPLRPPPDSTLGEQLLPDGSVPPPREPYPLRSTRKMNDPELWALLAASDRVAIVAVRDGSPRGYFRGKALVQPEQV